MSLRAVGVGAGLLAAALAFGMTAAYVAIRAGGGAALTHFAAHPGAGPPIASETKLQSDPVAEIAAYRAEKQRILDTYAWVDRDRRIVRIPIKSAIALAASESGARAAP